MKKILVVDDEPKIRYLFLETLEKNFSLDFLETIKSARNKIEKENFDLIFLDLKLPDGDGMEFLQEIMKEKKIPVCIITGYGTTELAVKAIKIGAYDFLEKPLNKEKIRIVTDNILNRVEKEKIIERLTQEIKREIPFVGKSNIYKEIIKKIETFSKSSSPVLITGETGVGKDVVARLLHYMSDRRSFPFEYINCASIPKDLLESELFGFKKGAFTGAHRDKKGKFELADKGSLLLNEICEMSKELQAKILDAIENKEIFPLGAEKDIKVDIRIISATNKNIEKEISKGNFREDLYYRLNVLKLNIPPLRERKEDIEPIAIYYLRKFCEENNKPYYEFSESALKYLIDYPFPGNVRELKNIIEKIVITKERGNIITVNDIKLAIENLNVTKIYDVSVTKPLKIALEEFKKDYILKCLEENGGNITLTAKKLGIHRVQLQRLLKEIKKK